MGRRLFVGILLIGAMLIVWAGGGWGLSAVGSGSCQRMAKTDEAFVLVLRRGESVLDGLLRCADAAGLASASVSGLGAVEDPTLAYYNLETKQYQSRDFHGTYELLGLNGNITQAGGKRVAHVHVTLGGTDYRTIGGHLNHALTGGTVEITVVPLKSPVTRKFDPATGLQLISPEE